MGGAVNPGFDAGQAVEGVVVVAAGIAFAGDGLEEFAFAGGVAYMGTRL